MSNFQGAVLGVTCGVTVMNFFILLALLDKLR